MPYTLNQRSSGLFDSLRVLDLIVWVPGGESLSLGVIHPKKRRSNLMYSYPYQNVEENGEKAVWNKGKKINQDGKKFDPNVWRWDICENVMKYSEHGNTESEHGWEIDHIYPSSKGGSDDIDNLQPLNWKNNRTKGDQYPWHCM
jgi:HNH endonuclease